MKVKGVNIEFFTLCMAFRKVIFFIYQKISLSDRVPLKLIKPASRNRVFFLEGISAKHLDWSKAQIVHISALGQKVKKIRLLYFLELYWVFSVKLHLKT